MADMIKGFSVNGEEYKVDYNSLGNKPFGVDTLVEIIPITDIETSGDDVICWSDNISIDPNNFPKIGDIYVVTFAGVEYEVTAFDGGASWNNEILLGEIDENGDEVFDRYPFLIDFNGSSYFELGTPAAGTYSVSIKKKDKTRIPLAYMPNELDVRNTYNTITSANDLEFENTGDSYNAEISETVLNYDTGKKYRITIGDYSTEVYAGNSYELESTDGSNYWFHIYQGYGTFIEINSDFYDEYHPTSVIIEEVLPNYISILKNIPIYRYDSNSSQGEQITLLDALNIISQAANLGLEFYENEEQYKAVRL